MKYDALYIRNVENQIESTCRVDTVGKGKRSKGEDSPPRKREGNVKRNSRRSVSRVSLSHSLLDFSANFR